MMLRREPGRRRMRRRLLVLSAPVVLLLVVAAVKMMSLAVVGDSAVSDFARGEGAALRADASRLGVLNLFEPARAPFAAGGADVLDGRLTDADADFSEALARTAAARSCDVRINVELVRETQGDVEAAAGRTAPAGERYRSALGVVGDAPENCFEGNSDPLADRRAVRHDAAARLRAKIAALQSVPAQEPAAPNAPPPPPPPRAGMVGGQPDTAPPALGPTGAGLSDIAPDRLPSPGAQPPGEHRLDPSGGAPLDRLRQLLTDAASSGSDSEGG